jgi:hypothetical protein
MRGLVKGGGGKTLKSPHVVIAVPCYIAYNAIHRLFHALEVRITAAIAISKHVRPTIDWCQLCFISVTLFPRCIVLYLIFKGDQ